MKFEDLVLEYEILSLLANSEGPVGATSLYIQLGSKLGVGQATIGRKLLEMDYSGLTSKRGFQGRIITDRGRTRLEELFREMSRGSYGGPMTQSLNLRSKEKLLEVLAIRLILESETARLAAQKASAEIIQRMDEVLDRQAEEVEKKAPGTEQDFEFHDLVAQASGNSVMKDVLILIRRESQLSRLVATIRQEVGGKLLLEHGEVLTMIKRREPGLAAAAMSKHIQGLVADVETFWEHIRLTGEIDNPLVKTKRRLAKG
ncbi:MAG: FCD domain-containing protein [Actinobacteria bacterium]|nr:FCD domain-containing protein [Actinomycetota bacterium]